MKEIEIVVCIIENEEGEILLQKKTTDYKRAPGVWTFFGGEAESEDLEKEMIRELKEELNFELPVKFLFKIHSGISIHVFYGKLNDLSKISLGEGAGFAFFARKELDDLKLDEVPKIVLNKYFNIK